MNDSTPKSPALPVGPTWNAKAYQAHRGILARCHRAKTKQFANYGGRGIVVCDRWRFGANGMSAFHCFFEDMGDPPTPQHSLDRIDVNGNYEPSNCRWITMAEQAKNKRCNRWLTGFGKTQLMADWAKEYGINSGLFYIRIVKQGLSVEEAVKSRSQVKLSLEKAREIRMLHKTEGIGAYRLAKRFGVCKSTITFVLTGQTWKDEE